MLYSLRTTKNYRHIRYLQIKIFHYNEVRDTVFKDLIQSEVLGTCKYKV